MAEMRIGNHGNDPAMIGINAQQGNASLRQLIASLIALGLFPSESGYE